MIRFEGKTVLVTGASRGIGEATARYFAKRGANVALLARSADDLLRITREIHAKGGTAIAIASDVARYDEIYSATQSVMEKFGKLDILVNNAGLIEPVARIADSDPKKWSHIVDVNFKGVYYGLRATIPLMLEAGSGTIINISSGAATSALEGWSHYCSTKAAVLSLTRCAHKEYGHQGVQVIGLSPGTVDTDMQLAIRQSGINPVSKLDPSAHIPPQWVAKAVGFLCGDGGIAFAGTDFSLKTNDGRQLVGLPMCAT
ncbi:FIG062860: Dehydrogenases with different specificities (related to short-chain alcohol dehydrogenases) [hydrothermal vent metagenome]|uniref:FIG062860: Dehydrogenases with different specificities (Related to short-chain alcohol dehydrogenases) n=1 Tax=hydrothermal vent metagenome TaxID=652676 RepID=A0A3B0RF53_9ZZZZ